MGGSVGVLRKDLARGLISAAIASALGSAINFATDSASNYLAWAAVGLLTLTSGTLASRWGSPPKQGRSPDPKRRVTVSTRHQGAAQKRTVTMTEPGIVKRHEIEIWPDGRRFERIEYFSESVALGSDKDPDETEP
jgi:hypothetical protein